MDLTNLSLADLDALVAAEKARRRADAIVAVIASQWSRS